METLSTCNNVAWSEYSHSLKDKTFSIMTINMRSLRNKFAELQVHLALLKKKISIIVITESWLSENNDLGYELCGYESVSLYRDGIGGGIKIYYLNGITVTKDDLITSNTVPAEVLMLLAHVPGIGKVNICGIYRPPNNSVTDFLSLFDQILYKTSDTKTIITGDINIDINETCPNSSNYTDMLTSYGFSNFINQPTYVSPTTNLPSSCVDHIISNICISSSSYVLKPNISDHFAVSTIFDKQLDEKPIEIKFRDFSDANRGKFLANIDREFISFNPPNHDVDVFANYLVLFLRLLLNKYFPIKTKKISYERLKAPWINKEILLCIRKKHKLHNMAKNRCISFESYKRYSALLRNVLETAVKDYHVFKLNQMGNDMKKNWALMNKLLNKKTKNISSRFVINDEDVTEPQLISNEFNNYFINHPVNISENIPVATNNYINMTEPNPIEMIFPQSCPDEIETVIYKMKKSGDIHDIPTKFLHICAKKLSSTLAELFNLCVHAGKFPKIFKTATVTPVFKKGARDRISNYRPISILSNLSKIFECLMFSRISSFFHNNGLLSDNQFGFRKGKNTELACISLVDRVIPAIENNEYAICIFLDFSACFDTLCRNILLGKIDNYGIRGNPHAMIQSYFSERDQCVKYNGCFSDTKTQEMGVIQGSKNGPLFFDIYSNDFNLICEERENLHFADDTCLIYTGNNLPLMTHHINERLKIILDWCNCNKLSINPSKSEMMIFTNKCIEVEPDIRLGSSRILRKSAVKYLGLNIDDTLKFNTHIDRLKTKLAQLSGASFKLKDHFNFSASKNFYFSCVYSHLTYCLPIFGGWLDTSRGEKLIKTHERIVNNLFAKYDKNQCVFRRNNLLKLKDVYKLYACIHVYKILQMNENATVARTLVLEAAPHDYLTRGRETLRTPFPRTNVIKLSYKYQFIHIWNTIPVDIKNSPSLRSFKRCLSSHFTSFY